MSVSWNAAERRKTWEQIDQLWDVLVIGGGITGAGILREASRVGLRVLLVEQRDFAWGTSSRSSKLVHGGLRYLKSGQVGLTRASVHGREQLLVDGPGLVDPLGFLLADYEGDSPGRFVYGAGLTIYDLLAMQWSHKYYSPLDFQMMAPYITPTGLRGGFHYQDAQTDDARLVLRVIREAVAGGGTAINYIRAEGLVRDESGSLVGVTLRNSVDGEFGPEKDVQARVIINATGAWADELRGQLDLKKRIRPLRGSHLIFPAWRFPVAQAVSFMHPIDGRPVFAFPWEGITLVGTTDVDCPPPLDKDPSITPEEVAYLMAAVTTQFPALNLTLDDVVSTFAGIRPVIGSGKAAPSDESRDHVIWHEDGLLTVTGGKLTTFRQTARVVLEQICEQLKQSGLDDSTLLESLHDDVPILEQIDAELPGGDYLDADTQRRLVGRYGADAAPLMASVDPDEMEFIPGTPFLWAELRWSARMEGVVHLDDLLLRRVRLGLLRADGGAELLPAIGSICRRELGWDEERWAREADSYMRLWKEAYYLPQRAAIPDWDDLLVEARMRQEEITILRVERRKTQSRQALATLLLIFSLFILWRVWAKNKNRTA
jgi:glycerol-3-phosphate dehydrogenase